MISIQTWTRTRHGRHSLDCLRSEACSGCRRSRRVGVAGECTEDLGWERWFIRTRKEKKGGPVSRNAYPGQETNLRLTLRELVELSAVRSPEEYNIFCLVRSAWSLYRVHSLETNEEMLGVVQSLEVPRQTGFETHRHRTDDTARNTVDKFLRCNWK